MACRYCPSPASVLLIASAPNLRPFTKPLCTSHYEKLVLKYKSIGGLAHPIGGIADITFTVQPLP